MATDLSAPLQPPQPTQPSQELQEPASLSEGQRLINTFFAPSKTFTDLRKNASWWAPFLIIVIVSVMFIYVVDQKVTFPKVVENLIELQPKQADRVDRLPADERQQVMQRQITVTKMISYAIPIIALGIYAVFAGVLFATLKFVASADLKYKTLFALVVYTRLPLLLTTLLAILSLLAGVSGDAFITDNPEYTNPGYLIRPDDSAVLRGLLTPLDLYSSW